MSKLSPEEIQMREAEIADRKLQADYTGSEQWVADEAWRIEVAAQTAEVEIIIDPETLIAEEPKPKGSPIVALAGEDLSAPTPRSKSLGELKAAKKSSTVMPMPGYLADAKPVELPKRFTLPGKLQKEYERARALSNVEKLGKQVFATKTVDPKRKELEAERKRANDMVSLVQQILDQRAQLAIALANVSSTINLKDRREEDLMYMGKTAASMSKTIVENLTDYDLQSYTLIAGLNNLAEDQALRRAGHYTRERVLELTKVAASMLADARFKIEQIRTAGRAAIIQRDEALKRVAELTGEEFKPEEPPKPAMN